MSDFLQPQRPVPRRVSTPDQRAALNYHLTQRRKAKAGERTPKERQIGLYNVPVNLMANGRFAGQALPAAVDVNIHEYFQVGAGGVVNAPNAPEINGTSTNVGDHIVATVRGYIVRFGG